MGVNVHSQSFLGCFDCQAQTPPPSSESTTFSSRAKHFAKGKAQKPHLQFHTSGMQGEFHRSGRLHWVHSCTRELLLLCLHRLKVLSWWWQGGTSSNHHSGELAWNHWISAGMSL